jgi:hypothetical protein
MQHFVGSASSSFNNKKTIPIVAAIVLILGCSPSVVAETTYDTHNLYKESNHGDIKALKKLIELSNQGDYIGEYWLGAYYYNKNEYGMSEVLFKKSASKGYGWAENMLGVSYYYGKGLRKDKISALKWWLLASLHRNPVYQSAMTNIHAVEQEIDSHDVYIAKKKERQYLASLWKSVGISQDETRELKSAEITPFYVVRMAKYKNNPALLGFYHELRIENDAETATFMNKVHRFCRSYSVGVIGGTLRRNPYRIVGRCFAVSGEIKQILGQHFGLFASFGDRNFAIMHFEPPYTTTHEPGKDKYFSGYVVAGKPVKYTDVLGEMRIVPSLYILRDFVHRSYVPLQ